MSNLVSPLDRLLLRCRPVHEVIATPRLELRLLDGPLEDALLAGDQTKARALAQFALPDGLFSDPQFVIFVAWKRRQVEAEPRFAVWSLRLVVWLETETVIGTANFHGPPGINDTGTEGASEFGYTILEAYRGRGFATEIGRAFIQFAEHEFGVRQFISGVRADNPASLRVNQKLGFVDTGKVVDDECIFVLDL